jgi:excisionase family DNA binding protein
MQNSPAAKTTITAPEIAKRLDICVDTVYAMLKSRTIPNIRYGHRFIVSRAAFERWESTIGEKAA